MRDAPIMIYFTMRQRRRISKIASWRDMGPQTSVIGAVSIQGDQKSSNSSLTRQPDMVSFT